MTPRTRIPRRLSLVILLTTILLGYLSRTHPIGFFPWDKSLGDFLYAFAFYFALLLLAPSLRPLAAFATTITFCLLIESFKLTTLPAAWSQSPNHAFSLLSRLLFGTTPSLQNIICYVAATVTAALIHTSFLGIAKRRAR